MVTSSSGDTPLMQTYVKDGKYHLVYCGEDIVFNEQEKRLATVLDLLELYEIYSAKC